MANDGEAPPALWCRHCGEPVTRSGSRTGPVVHAATGAGGCADGNHTAEPSATDPEMHRQAREISAEFGDRWEIDVRLGYFSAVRRGVRGARVPVAGETADEIRANLKMRESVDEWRAKDLARAEGAPS